MPEKQNIEYKQSWHAVQNLSVTLYKEADLGRLGDRLNE
jgi:hypothetical protein